jgi:hypothetical protein
MFVMKNKVIGMIRVLLHQYFKPLFQFLIGFWLRIGKTCLFFSDIGDA